MTAFKLILRNLAYYRGTTATGVVGVAVATAVLVGSLVVGQSVRMTVRENTLSRLGRIDTAMQSPRPFDRGLADRLAAHPSVAETIESVVPVRIVAASARRTDDDRLLPRVRVVGVPEVFWSLFDRSAPSTFNRRTVAVSQTLADQLGADSGTALLLTVERDRGMPAGSLFDYRDTRHTRRTTRVTVGEVLPDRGVGGFSLDAEGGPVRNIFMPLADLNRLLDSDRRADVLLLQLRDSAIPTPVTSLQEPLSQVLTLEQLGVHIEPRDDLLIIESTQVVFSDIQSRAIHGAIGLSRHRRQRVSVYLADSIRVVGRPDAVSHYAVMAGMDNLPRFRVVAGTGHLDTSDQVLLNSWIAEDLEARPGDKLLIRYRVPNPDGTYATVEMTRTLVGIVGTDGPGADRTLVPDFPGITDAASIADWDPPFPIDMDKVTERDEIYWDRHRSAPKVFLTLPVVRHIWSTDRPGSMDGITSIRIDVPRARVDEVARDLARQIRKDLSPEDVGMVFRPVRQLALQSASSPTDFAMLFGSMSAFIIVAALVLVGSLLRLSLEQRSGQVGMMLASGWSTRRISRLLLGEGLCLALVGALAGIPLGVAWAWLIVRALNTAFSAATAHTTLALHVTTARCLAGAGAGFVAAAISAWWALRQLRRQRVLDLLAGSPGDLVAPRRSGRIATGLAVACPLGVVALLVLYAAGMLDATAAFFPAGALLLAGGLGALHRVLAAAPRRRGVRGTVRLAVRNAAGNRLRSLLVAGLVAVASFVLVSVAANRRDYAGLSTTERNGPTGGFALVGRSLMPLPASPATEAGRRGLGFTDEQLQATEGIVVYPMLQRPGQDISCLSLKRAVQPALLGAGPAFIDASPFTVLVDAHGKNPWKRLEEDLPNGDIPVIADAASVRWQLQKGLGDLVVVQAENGQSLKLRIVGLIESSFMAGHLVMSEHNLRTYYPSIEKPTYFLFETPPGRVERVQRTLQQTLGPHGLDVQTTRSLLNDLISVQNTYLTTFLVLGGLGLGLGAFGMVTVLLRNALERRGELALMTAAGFSRRQLAGLLALENGLLLAAGLLLGTVSALVASAGQLTSADSDVNWVFLATVLVSMGGVGLVAGAASARLAVRGRLLDGLRRE